MCSEDIVHTTLNGIPNQAILHGRLPRVWFHLPFNEMANAKPHGAKAALAIVAPIDTLKWLHFYTMKAFFILQGPFRRFKVSGIMTS